MAKMGLDTNLDFSREYFMIWEILRKACLQMRDYGELEANTIRHMESKIMYLLYFKDLTQNEELIREQLINAAISIIDVSYMFNTLKNENISLINEQEVSLKAKMRVILDVIKELSDDKGKVSIDIVENKMLTDYNLEKENFEKIIRKLIVTGLLYEPSNRFLKLV